MANNNDGQIVLGLDIPKTVSQINADIKKLQNQLEQIKATGALDTSATVKQINAQIASLQSQLKEINLKTNIDVNSASKNAVNQAQQVGQQIGNSIYQGISSGVNKAKSELKSFSDLTNFSELNKKIEHLQIDPSALKNYSNILDEVKAKYAEFGQVKITNEQFNNGILEKFKVNIEQVNGDLKETKSFMMALNDDKDTFVFDGIIKGSESVVQHLDKTNNAINQTADAINSLQLNNKADKIQLSTDVTKLTTDYQKFGVVSQEVENNLKELKLAQEAVVNAKGTDRLATEIERYNTKLAETKSSLKELTTTQVSLNQRTSQMKSMQEWMRKNKNATKLVGDQVRQLIEECNTCDDVRFNGIKREFDGLVVQAGKAGKLGNSLFSGLIEQGKKFVQWIGVTGTVMRGIQISRDMIQNVKDLDDSLLELVKVSDLSASGLEKVTEQAYELGEKVGRTGRQVIDAVTEFKRAGYEMQDSLNMAEAALVMTNVAEGINDTADAAGTLISVLKGYNMAESDAMSIVDMMNSTSNQSPIGFDELAEGLERTAGTMAQSGTTIQETIGLITAGYAQLRNVEKVSTSLITLSARLRGVNEDGEEIDGLSAELQESFGKIGVAIEDADGNLRSIYAIAKDYAKVLPTLTSEQKQYYAELAAGKRNVTTWNAITQQFQDAENATAQAIDSVGSASDENSKYLDSISGKVSQFNSAVEQLSSTIVDSDLIKFFVDLGTTGVKAIDGLVNALGGLGTIGLLGGVGLGIKNIGRPKMFGLYKYADINMCSLGY